MPTSPIVTYRSPQLRHTRWRLCWIAPAWCDAASDQNAKDEPDWVYNRSYCPTLDALASSISVRSSWQTNTYLAELALPPCPCIAITLSTSAAHLERKNQWTNTHELDGSSTSRRPSRPCWFCCWRSAAHRHRLPTAMTAIKNWSAT